MKNCSLDRNRKWNRKSLLVVVVVAAAVPSVATAAAGAVATAAAGDRRGKTGKRNQKRLRG